MICVLLNRVNRDHLLIDEVIQTLLCEIHKQAILVQDDVKEDDRENNNKNGTHSKYLDPLSGQTRRGGFCRIYTARSCNTKLVIKKENIIVINKVIFIHFPFSNKWSYQGGERLTDFKKSFRHRGKTQLTCYKASRVTESYVTACQVKACHVTRTPRDSINAGGLNDKPCGRKQATNGKYLFLCKFLKNCLVFCTKNMSQKCVLSCRLAPHAKERL
jgi:hypothetical protein